MITDFKIRYCLHAVSVFSCLETGNFINLLIYVYCILISYIYFKYSLPTNMQQDHQLTRLLEFKFFRINQLT